MNGACVGRLLVAPVAVTVCWPRLAPAGMVMTFEIDPAPLAVVIPTTLVSNMMVTVSLGENPRPFTVLVLPGGPKGGWTRIQGTSPVTVAVSMDPFEYENVYVPVVQGVHDAE